MAEARVTFVVEGGQELRTVLDEISRSTAKINGETAKMEQMVERASNQLKDETDSAQDAAEALKDHVDATTASGAATKKHITYSDKLTESFGRKLYGTRQLVESFNRLSIAVVGVGVGIPALIGAFADFIKNEFEAEAAANKAGDAFVYETSALRGLADAAGSFKSPEQIQAEVRGIANAFERGQTEKLFAPERQFRSSQATAEAQLTKYEAETGKKLPEEKRAVVVEALAAKEAALAHNMELADKEFENYGKTLYSTFNQAIAAGKAFGEGGGYEKMASAIQETQGKTAAGREYYRVRMEKKTAQEQEDILKAAFAAPTTATGGGSAGKAQVDMIKSAWQQAKETYQKIYGEAPPSPIDPALVTDPLSPASWLAAMRRMGGRGLGVHARTETAETPEYMPLPQTKEEDEALQSFGEQVQTTVGNAIGEGVTVGLTGNDTKEKVKAFGNILVSVLSSVLSAIPGIGPLLKGFFGGLGGIRFAGGGYNTGLGWIPAADGFAGNINSPTLIPGMGGPPVLAGERGRELMMILNQQQEQNLMNLVGRGLTAQQQVQSGPTIYTSAYLGGDDMPRRIKNSHLQGQVQQEAARI